MQVIFPLYVSQSPLQPQLLGGSALFLPTRTQWGVPWRYGHQVEVGMASPRLGGGDDGNLGARFPLAPVIP